MASPTCPRDGFRRLRGPDTVVADLELDAIVGDRNGDRDRGGPRVLGRVDDELLRDGEQDRIGQPRIVGRPVHRELEPPSGLKRRGGGAHARLEAELTDYRRVE